MNARQHFAAADNTADCAHQAAIAFSDQTTCLAERAIRAIPIGLFDERCMCNLITVLQGRLDQCGWKHQAHASEANEALTDVFIAMENAAEAKELG